MKTDELKLRVKKFLGDTIDLYFPSTNMGEKLKNATAKLYLEQNMWKLDKIIDSFGDENQCIDGGVVEKTYGDVLFQDGELKVDLKDYLSPDTMWAKSWLPNKIVLFRRDDFHNLFM